MKRRLARKEKRKNEIMKKEDEIKIKKEDGDYKKKVETAEGEEYKLKVDEDGEVKEKTDN